MTKRCRKATDCGVFVASVVITLSVIAVLAWLGWSDYRDIFDRGGEISERLLEAHDPAADWGRRFTRNALVAFGLLIVAWGALWAAWRGTLRERALINDLETALADNKVLFNEIHHRVKNNMQIINSMLMMEQVRSRDPVMSQRLETLAGRISSMALVHVMLYERHEASHVDMTAYLHELCANLSASFAAAERGVTVIVDCNGSSLPMEKAVPVGLLVNEAVSNAFKHAFPQGRTPDGEGHAIRVMFAGGSDGLHISVSDDGVGMPAQPQVRDESEPGLGVTIMHALAAQLGGTAEFAPGPGTVLRVWCPGPNGSRHSGAGPAKNR